MAKSRDWAAVDELAEQWKPPVKRETKAQTFKVDLKAMTAFRVWCEMNGCTLSEGVSEALRRLVSS